ncbi:DNA polymerase III subunit gamma/tau [Brevibacillus sp. GCM10020057]|uniref:DNA polymerase III subunit gamma/tau n=1 Tax=Brevibacillus sp. GCM10020057 TaxID=3317327 RepID=UPI003634B707
MRRRELLFGFGAGLIVAAGIAGWHQGQQAPAAAAALTSEQIKQAAEELQMVVLSKDEYDQWQQEKKVNVKPAPNAPKAPAAPQTGNTGQPQSPSAAQPTAPTAPAEQKQAGATQPAVQQQGEVLTPTVQQPVDAASPVQVKQPATPPVEPAQPKRQVTFSIPYKATAEGVAKQLAAEGILPADNKLVEELRSQGKLNRIRVGTYQITTPASVADIVKLITTPPQQ